MDVESEREKRRSHVTCTKEEVIWVFQNRYIVLFNNNIFSCAQLCSDGIVVEFQWSDCTLCEGVSVRLTLVYFCFWSSTLFARALWSTWEFFVVVGRYKENSKLLCMWYTLQFILYTQQSLQLYYWQSKRVDLKCEYIFENVCIDPCVYAQRTVTLTQSNIYTQWKLEKARHEER